MSKKIQLNEENFYDLKVVVEKIMPEIKKIEEEIKDQDPKTEFTTIPENKSLNILIADLYYIVKDIFH